MAGWSVDEVIIALMEDLEARPWFVAEAAAGRPVPVFDTFPAEAPLQHASFGDAESVDNIAGMQGGQTIARKINEVYDLDLFVFVTIPGGSASAARQRAIAISKEIEDQVATKPRITETVQSARISKKRLVQNMTDDGRVAVLRLAITITARR